MEAGTVYAKADKCILDAVQYKYMLEHSSGLSEVDAQKLTLHQSLSLFLESISQSPIDEGLYKKGLELWLASDDAQDFEFDEEYDLPENEP